MDQRNLHHPLKSYIRLNETLRGTKTATPPSKVSYRISAPHPLNSFQPTSKHLPHDSNLCSVLYMASKSVIPKLSNLRTIITPSTHCPNKQPPHPIYRPPPFVSTQTPKSPHKFPRQSFTTTGCAIPIVKHNSSSTPLTLKPTQVSINHSTFRTEAGFFYNKIRV
jgi:hypothetical protein